METRKYSITLNVNKCVFAKPKVKFLTRNYCWWLYNANKSSKFIES